MDKASRRTRVTVPVETELKLALTADAAVRLQADVFGTSPAVALHSIYFDTRARAVSAAGFTLRLRRSGNKWVQTLKGEAVGLSRSEQETARPDGTLDLELLASGPLGKIAKAADLAPVFETWVQRRTRTINADGAKIELALDEGEIVAGASREMIRELEFELKSGVLAAVFKRARRMFDAGGMSVLMSSKSDLGYALASGLALAPVKFRALASQRTTTAGHAFRVLALGALRQVQANASLLEFHSDPEAVHQARIGLRRLRVMVCAFAALVGDKEFKTVKTELSRLTHLFANARSLDVFIGERLKPSSSHEAANASFDAALDKAQARAYAEIRQAVLGQPFAQAVFELTEWIVTGPWTRAPKTSGQAARPIANLAADLLQRRHKELLRRGEKLNWRNPTTRHKLRIEAKAMAYLADAFAPLFGSSKRFMKRLKRFQDVAGRLNDIATAPGAARLAIDTALAPDAAFSAGLKVGERCGHERRLRRKAKKVFEAFAAEPCFWSS